MTKSVSLLSLVFFALPQHSIAEPRAACENTSLSPSSQSSSLKKTLFGGTPDEAVVSRPEKDSPRDGIFPYDQSSQVGDYSVSHDPDSNKVVGFGFQNLGPNSIVTASPKGEPPIPVRNFQIDFPDRARREITFAISDIGSHTLSEQMETEIMFFPRKVLPAMQWNIDESPNLFRVILPNGEGVYFDKKTKTMVGGALKETRPLDTNPDHNKRKFAGFEYSGAGVMIQVNRRGETPRMKSTATVTKNGKTCQIPSSLLYNQSNSDTSFKFASDDALDALLKQKCGFGI